MVLILRISYLYVTYSEKKIVNNEGSLYSTTSGGRLPNSYKKHHEAVYLRWRNSFRSITKYLLFFKHFIVPQY